MQDWFNLRSIVDDRLFRDVKCIVYIVRNIQNGKMYVGKTKGALCSRLRAHVACSEQSKFAFHKAIKKYGTENFEVNVFYRGSSNEEISKIEIETIEKLQTFVFGGKGYNVLTGGENSRPYTEKTRKKISDAKKGVPLSEEAKRSIMKKVIQIDMNTNEHIKVFPSINSATEELKIVNIGKCCRGELSSAGKFKWKFANKLDLKKGLWSIDKRMKMSKRMLENNPNDHPVEMLDHDGNVIKTFTSIRKAIDETGTKNISSVCRGVRKTAGGFKWRYKS